MPSTIPHHLQEQTGFHATPGITVVDAVWTHWTGMQCVTDCHHHHDAIAVDKKGGEGNLT